MIFSIEPKKKFETTSVAYWENFLTEEDINKILNLPEWNNLKEGQIGNERVNTSIRDSKINWLSLNQETLEIYQKISNTISFVNSRFFNFDLSGLYEQIQLGLYDSKDKGHYDWHIDCGYEDYTNVPRKLSMALLLNSTEDFEGGEFQVKIDSDVSKNLELKKGRAWFFPSWVLHRVAPVTKGVRKSLVVWAGGPSFK
jgi:PKHD-type hydroxylase